MRLLIKRSQTSGLPSGAKFELQARTQLTAEEAELVKTFNLTNEVVLKKKIQTRFADQLTDLELKIEDLIQGRRFACTDVADILEMEKSVKEGCENFLGYLEVVKNFTGERAIEYPMTHVSSSGERLVEFDLGVSGVRSSPHEQARGVG